MHIRQTVLVAVTLLAGIAGPAVAGNTSYTYDALGRLTNVSYACRKSAAYVYDPAGNRSSTATGTAANVAPVAVNDPISTVYRTAKTFDPRSNDADADCDYLTIVSISTPSHGNVVINSGTSLTYTPVAGYSGSDSFTYTISDSNSHTATATVTATVTGSNQTPVVANDGIATPENTAKTFDPRANDYDPDGDAITITGASTPSHGTVTVNSGTSLTYTPATNYNGSDSFTYTVSDGYGGTATGTISATVSFVNHAPIAVTDSVTTSMNTAIAFDPRANDSDPDGDALTVTGTTAPSHGSVSIGGSGTSLTYTPTTGYSGSDSFTYTVIDTHSTTAATTVSVTVVANRSPVAVNDTATLFQASPPYGPWIIPNFNPLANDSDPDGDALTIAGATVSSGCSVYVNNGTTLTIMATPPPTKRTCVATYTISDGRGGTANATVTAQ